ncbi:MAG: hypothetical protein OEM15_01070 [Myxococcales bacterium]|nr:hypothetical protein [Myxococcales bacterium]MDH3483768.1 hypothetical protein [Myxococcales bacterium]
MRQRRVNVRIAEERLAKRFNVGAPSDHGIWLCIGALFCAADQNEENEYYNVRKDDKRTIRHSTTVFLSLLC